MQAQRFTLEKMGTVQLHYKDSKFWEITLKNNVTTSLYGKLISGNEDKNKITKNNPKAHESVREAINYLESHVSRKLAKGYKIKKMKPVQDERINIEEEDPNQFVVDDVPFQKKKKEDSEEIDSPEGTENLNSLLNNNKNQEPAGDHKGSYLCIEDGKRVKFFKISVLDKYVKIERGIEGEILKGKPSYLEFKDKIEAENFAMKIALQEMQQGFEYAPNKFRYSFIIGEIPNEMQESS